MVTEIAGNCTVCASWAAAPIQGASDSDPTKKNAMMRPAHTRRVKMIWEDTATPRAAGVVARHRELGAPLIRFGCLGRLRQYTPTDSARA